jgi:hypothetical protein
LISHTECPLLLAKQDPEHPGVRDQENRYKERRQGPETTGHVGIAHGTGGQNSCQEEVAKANNIRDTYPHRNGRGPVRTLDVLARIIIGCSCGFNNQLASFCHQRGTVIRLVGEIGRKHKGAEVQCFHPVGDPSAARSRLTGDDEDV